MTRDEITLAISIGNFILTWGVALYMYLANKNKATNERIAKLEDDIGLKLEGHIERITKLETTTDKAPSHADLANKNEATNERIAKLEDDIGKKLEGHVQRIAKLETTADKAPSHADLAKVYDSLNALAGTVNQLVGENKGQSDTLRLILNQITEKGMR